MMKEVLHHRPATIESLRRTFGLRFKTQQEIKRGQETATYGPYVEKMVAYGRDQVRRGRLDGQLVERALGTASLLFQAADVNYRKGKHPLSGEALAQHQGNVLSGTIQLVPPESATTVEESIQQVEHADRMLQNPKVQQALAAINYGAFFRPQTMASATKTLDRGQIDDLLTTVAASQEAMPHLTISNWAIGQTVAGIYQHLAQQSSGRLRLIDIGSGTGATLAAITSSLNNVAVERKPEIGITGIEPTPEFFDELAAFVTNDRGLSQLGLTTQVEGSGRSTLSSPGSLKVILGNALEFLQEADVKNGLGEGDITVVTANYSWHRLSSKTKKAIMTLLHDVPNTIFLIGDLTQNSSTINRRYFNLGVNGPLNCGNLGLSDAFKAAGYTLIDLNQEKPTSLDGRLAQRISYEDRTNDGHLWIAYNGSIAAKAFNLIPNAI